MQHLTSNIDNLNGGNANQFYHKQANTGEVVDIVLSNMSPEMTEAQVKQIANVKHVISANVDIDNLKGTCTGTGRIQVRLNDDETAETVR